MESKTQQLQKWLVLVRGGFIVVLVNFKKSPWCGIGMAIQYSKAPIFYVRLGRKDIGNIEQVINDGTREKATIIFRYEMDCSRKKENIIGYELRGIDGEKLFDMEDPLTIIDFTP